MPLKILPMDAAYFETFRADHVDAQSPEFAQSFALTVSAARRMSAENLSRALPEREATESNYLYMIHDDFGEKIGHLWLTERTMLEKRSLFISDIFIEASHRGQGLGNELLAWVDVEAKRLGHTEITLHVFGSNHRAKRLYASLGYRETSVHMAKTI